MLDTEIKNGQWANQSQSSMKISIIETLIEAPDADWHIGPFSICHWKGAGQFQITLFYYDTSQSSGAAKIYIFWMPSKVNDTKYNTLIIYWFSHLILVLYFQLLRIDSKIWISPCVGTKSCTDKTGTASGNYGNFRFRLLIWLFSPC